MIYTVLATGTDFLSFLLVRSHQLVNILCAGQLQGRLHNAYCYNPGEYSWQRNWPLIAWILACELKYTSEPFSLVFAQFESNNQNLSFSPCFTCFTPCENLQGPVDNSTLANRTLACSKHPYSRGVSYSTSPCICVKARLMRVTSHQEYKQTWENCGWVAEKKGNLKCWKVL